MPTMPQRTPDDRKVPEVRFGMGQHIGSLRRREVLSCASAAIPYSGTTHGGTLSFV